MSKPRKVLLIGWDAADWKVINPLLDSGRMPALASLVDKGVVANIATLDPPLSPMLWTSIATGKTADKHGIISFVEPVPDQGGVRPVNVTSRKTRALWNILHNQGLRCNVVGWWPSHPAEPIRGAMVSNFYQQAGKPLGEPWKMPKGTVYPAELRPVLAPLRVHPGELTDAHLLPFIPGAAHIDQEKDQSLTAVAKIVAHASSVHSAATWLMRNTEWDFMAVYYDAIDHFGHGFMKYHPPRQEHIPEDKFELYREVVNGGYIFHDMMLERLLKLAGEDTTVILISDHGFHSDHLRPKYLPKLPAAPAYEHSPYGIFCASGPGIKQDERIFGATLLDITPTILTLYGLPVGADMDGKVLLDAFTEPLQPAFIESWDKKDGDFGEHPPHLAEDTFASAEALKQLVELGYVEDPGEDKTDAMLKATMEAKYNLSRVYQSKKNYAEAIVILKELFENKKDDIRIGLDLTKCLINASDYAGARESLEFCRTTEYGKMPVLDFLEGVINFSEGHSREALDFLKAAEKSDPRMPELHLQLGKLYLQVHEYANAGEAFSKAAEIDENNATAYLGIGISELRQGRYEEAVDYLLSSLGLIYHFPIAHYHLGEALYHMGKYKESSEAFEVCLRMAPKLLKARRFLVKIYQGPYPDPLRLKEHTDILKQRMKGTVVVVSGLPRSGTSLMMQMLQAGGMPLLTDGLRQPDENNPRGYYELDAVKRSASDISWVAQAEDKAVKVIAQLLYNLPNNYEFKVIFMQRDIKEVMLSQQKMLGKSAAYNMSLAAVFEKEIEKVKAWEKQQPNVEVLYVPYAELVGDPLRHVHRIADFTGYPLDTEAMQQAVDRSLYRNRTNG